MMIAVMIASSLLMVGVFALWVFLIARASGRRSAALTDALIARMEARAASTPPLEPYVREPLPDFDPPEAELRITITRHPESDGDRLPKIAADLVRTASRLEESFGGDGLRYDEAGSATTVSRSSSASSPTRWTGTSRTG